MKPLQKPDEKIKTLLKVDKVPKNNKCEKLAKICADFSRAKELKSERSLEPGPENF